ncbi:MAG: nucleoside hydrolase [Candidatus Helarchaeota archaeon]
MKTSKIPVILDTDIGVDIDDTWALGLLLKCPELDVKLITTNSEDTTIKAKLVAKFLELVGRTDIPIGIGLKENRNKGSLFSWVKDYNLTQYPGKIYENGVDALCSTISQSPKPLTLIAIGPLGNIATALKVNPDITKNARFVGMQGSIRIGYKGQPFPHPEYNVIHNIKACREVFQAPWEITITPLDTCGNIILSGENFQRITNANNPIINAIKENFEIYVKKRKLSHIINKEKRTTILFDTVAIYLAFSEDFVNIENLKIEITEKGFTKISNEGKNIRCATSWNDLQAFKDLIVNRLINIQ